MISRSQIKERAKISFKRNYWMAVLIALILLFVGGTSSNYLSTYDIETLRKSVGRQNYAQNVGSEYGSSSVFERGFLEGYNVIGTDDINKSALRENQKSLRENKYEFTGIVFLTSLFMLIALAVVIVGALLSLFLFAPIQIGCKRWFILNKSEKPMVEEVGVVFKGGYLNTVKVMFIRAMCTLGWTLLFVIPGIYKQYEYRLIPYLLAENPQMSKEEAFRLTKEIMYGHKFESFIFDLSFIGWHFVSVITFGIAGILWTNPYCESAYAEYYIALCQNYNYGTANMMN